MTSAATAVLVEDEPLLLNELRNQLQRLWPDLTIVAEANDGDEAIRQIASHNPQIVFLDIQIPGMGGLEIAQRVSGRAHVVFVTAHEEFAVTAFEQGAVDYLVKPLDITRLATTVGRLKMRLDQSPPDLGDLIERLMKSRERERIRWIQASVGNKIRIIPTEEVIYFQSEAKYTKVAAVRGDMHIRRTIKELTEQLDPELFWQVNRGIIVNVAHIEEVLRDGEYTEIRMRGRPEKLPVSQPFYHLFRRS
jgi:DNA-binding LytR/AlgR family response regulator